MSRTLSMRSRVAQALVTAPGLIALLAASGAEGTTAAQTPRRLSMTDLVSVSTSGTVGNHDSQRVSISGDGEVMAFESWASDLVDHDTNEAGDVFARDVGSGITTLVSVATNGTQAASSSNQPSISADGRYVAFSSAATNLVPADTNGQVDIFVRDLVARRTSRVSVSSDEDQANGDSTKPSISGDGRFVTFETAATNLAGEHDVHAVFVRDLDTGQTYRMSISSLGVKGNGGSWNPQISANGRFVAFTSKARNLVASDIQGRTDIFVRDRRDKITTRVSVNDAGRQANWHSDNPSISANGRYVAFTSTATNLVWGDTNDTTDVFVHDSLSGLTRRMSVSTSGAQANSASSAPQISADGQHVTFSSRANNLLPGFQATRTRVFVRHRLAKVTEQVSLTASGADPNGDSYEGSISFDGTAIAFDTSATNVVADDVGDFTDVYLRR